MKPFAQTSYRMQVKRMRRLAQVAVTLFPLGPLRELKFINHGENTTFRATCGRGRRFLIRIHRDGYHSLEALNEELGWLNSRADNPNLRRHFKDRLNFALRTLRREFGV